MILDTNALSAFVDGHPGVGAILRGQQRAAIPVIVLGEFRYGIAHSRRRSSDEAWLESYLNQFDVLFVTDETAVAYAGLRVAWIAPLALQHRLPVLSRDDRFDVVPHLDRRSW